MRKKRYDIENLKDVKSLSLFIYGRNKRTIKASRSERNFM